MMSYVFLMFWFIAYLANNPTALCLLHILILCYSFSHHPAFDRCDSSPLVLPSHPNYDCEHSSIQGGTVISINIQSGRERGDFDCSWMKLPLLQKTLLEYDDTPKADLPANAHSPGKTMVTKRIQLSPMWRERKRRRRRWDADLFSQQIAAGCPCFAETLIIVDAQLQCWSSKNGLLAPLAGVVMLVPAGEWRKAAGNWINKTMFFLFFAASHLGRSEEG